MIKLQAKAELPTKWGSFTIAAFAEDQSNWMPHIAMISKDIDYDKPVNVRIHSECLTGDIFHSVKCDCNEQLSCAMNYVSENDGIVLYLRQEGRNIGIINKLKAYALQDEGLDTVEANLKLNLPADGRDFSVAIEMLKQLNVKSINLLTNNPEKLGAIKDSDIILNERIPLEMQPRDENKEYLETKKDFFGHLLDLKL